MNYIDVIYNQKSAPFTLYPNQLTAHICEIHSLAENKKLLDVGCGRGEFSRGFLEQNLDVFSVDQLQSKDGYVGSDKFFQVDLENQKLPFPNDYFDFVFSKSVIEHFYYPEKVFQELFRVLKPGGQIITMCPAWEYNFRIYFEDFTHRTPFMKVSLRDFLLISGFKNVEVDYFIQLPSTWKGGKATVAKFLCFLTRWLAPSSLKKKFKWVRFSKEVMLYSIAQKP